MKQVHRYTISDTSIHVFTRLINKMKLMKQNNEGFLLYFSMEGKLIPLSKAWTHLSELCGF